MTGAAGAGGGDDAARREITDAEAVARAREGDHAAFRVLVERWERRAHGLAMRVLRDEEAARDAVQEAFLRVYGALRRFEGRASFGTWLHRVVWNVCIDAKRRDRSGREVAWEDESASALDDEGGRVDEMPVETVGPERSLERRRLGEGLAQAIAALPEPARTTLLMREVDGLSYGEIAEALGVPKGTVMSRLHYARQRVQRTLIESGLAEPDDAGRAVPDDAGRGVPDDGTDLESAARRRGGDDA